MPLRSASLPTALDTSTANIIADFFVPALSNSIKYDRGVGFFSAGWLRLTAPGMTPFAANGGHARWVTSPILDEADWLALQQGAAARHDPIIKSVLERNIENLAASLERNTLSALAWMVADDILDFRLALPRNKLEGGEFHDKFGIFTDKNGDQVSFNGSYNESVQGTRNYEALRIFSSWVEPFTSFVKSDHERFERLWNNYDPNVQVYTLPDAALANILKLRTYARPYPEPSTIKTILHLSVAEPRVPPDLILRDYQLEAIKAWFDNGCVGLLEMATGTGKTRTSLAAMSQLFERERRLAIVIAVPYQHLVDQWMEDAKAFGLRPLLAYKKKSNWLGNLHQQVLEFNSQSRKQLSVITTHTTFIDPDFQEIIGKLQKPSLLIADEVHHLGSERGRLALPINISARLALSATPDRWFDDIGTQALREYFGTTVFRFTLADAIARGILVPYMYHPHLVELTEDESKEYQDYSQQIARLSGMLSSGQNEGIEKRREKLLMQRANILNRASQKLIILRAIINETHDAYHTLFYCSPNQIDEVCHILGWEYKWKINRFTAEEPNEVRQQLLKDFDNQEIQALVAMKCLDEGVDVPNTRTAYILASSSNPREFVQRRGRVLRRAIGKEKAVIHDFIVTPARSWYDKHVTTSERSMLQHELQRFKEFADTAQNKHQAINVIWDVAKQYNIHI